MDRSIGRAKVFPAVEVVIPRVKNKAVDQNRFKIARALSHLQGLGTADR